MKATKSQLTAATLANVLMLLAVFHQPLGLSDAWEMIFLLACLVSWIVYFMLRRRQKARRTDSVAAAQPSQVAPRQSASRLISLVVMVLVALSSPWWLPFTGVQLSFAQSVVVAVIGCVACVTIYLIALRHSTPKA
jgi:hypothetical protein